MGRTENINVFQDTMNLCKSNHRIRAEEWSAVQMRRKSACADVPGCLSA